MRFKCIGLLCFVMVVCGWADAVASAQGVPPVTNRSDQDVETAEPPGSKKFKTTKAQSLFAGKSLGRWEITSFGGEGDVEVEAGCIVMQSGDPFTAINLPEDFELPTVNYEVEYEAMKLEGTDFFGTLTFPVNDSFCTLVIGGWAGTVVGLSSIDGLDASENETRQLKKFEKNRWYKIKVRVTGDAIEGWIDGQRIVNQPILGKKVTLRNEMIPCRPLGIANFYTIAKLRNIRLRWISANEKWSP